MRNIFVYTYPFAGVFFLNGVRLQWKNRKGKYLILLTIGTIIVNLILIKLRVVRLFFNVIPVYILIASVGLVGFIAYLCRIQSLDSLAQDIRRQFNPKRILFWVAIVFLSLQVFIRLTWRNGVYDNLLNAYGIVFRYLPGHPGKEYDVPDQTGVYAYIKEHMQPGDKVSSTDLQVSYAFFAGKHCDFLFRQNYVTESDYDYKSGGYQLSNIDKIKNVLRQNHRTWFVFVKNGMGYVDPKARDYVVQRSEKVYSNPKDDVEVYLFTPTTSL